MASTPGQASSRALLRLGVLALGWLSIADLQASVRGKTDDVDRATALLDRVEQLQASHPVSAIDCASEARQLLDSAPDARRLARSATTWPRSRRWMQPEALGQ